MTNCAASAGRDGADGAASAGNDGADGAASADSDGADGAGIQIYGFFQRKVPHFLKLVTDYRLIVSKSNVRHQKFGKLALQYHIILLPQ